MKPLIGKNKSSGMTLIELLIALSIAAIGMTSIIGLFVIGLNTFRRRVVS